MNTKPFVFLVTDGDMEIIIRYPGGTKEGAKEQLAANLNPFHNIVEDQESIREYIAQSERALKTLPILKSKALTEYVEDLATLKESIAEKEVIEC